MKINMKSRKMRVIIASACVVVIAVTTFFIANFANNKTGLIIKKPVNKIEVTADEMANYKQKIGANMDIKRSVMILFNTKDEAQKFINENADKDVLKLNIGLIPKLEEKDGVKFYNVVGNGVFEPIFDRLNDGEYSKEPISFGGMWAYFKRIDVYRPLENEKDLKAFIQNEKSMKKVGE